MALVVSPLAPASFPHLPEIAGVKLAAAAAGIRYKNRADVFVALLDKGTTVAACLTNSKSRSAPVDWCADNLKHGTGRVLVVNAGNANAFTGKKGVATVKAVAAAAAKQFGCKPSEVFQSSTGVIGEPLDPALIINVLPQIAASVSADAWDLAARAIMTTDTFQKLATAQVKLGDKTVTINGIAKGSGMVAPDMATMLVYIFTDANVPAKVLQKLLTKAVVPSFNCITVDGDTSTSDTVLMFATGKTGTPLKALKSEEDVRLKAFSKALNAVCHDLAIQVVKDGEGAEKLVEIKITGAESDKAAKTIGMTIANSPLVKTAIAGEDANWGRIVMAIGKSGEKALRDKLRIKIGGILVAAKGMKDPTYKEADIMPHMKGRDIKIEADIGVGKGKATVWTCDLTHRYIDINGSYRS
jgi:glutamate N-acetyltransferase / amino-acid N-acetyltransferase